MSHNDALPSQPGIKRYFYVQSFCFARIGVDATSLERTLVSYFLAWCPAIAQVALCFPNLLYAIKNIHDLGEVTDSLAPFWQGVMGSFKFMHFIWNRKKIVALIRKLWLRNLKAKGEELAILSAENRKDIILCNFYHMAVIMTGFFGVLAPLVIAAFYAWRGQNFFEHLEAPVKGFYVIDKISLLCYSIVFTWDVTAIYFVINISVAIDTLFSWFVCNVVAQFRIIKLRLHLAGRENKGNCSMKTICDCIVYYGRTIELANDLNDAFCAVVFIKFTISCIQICCLAFQFSRGGELMNQVFHGLFLIAVSMQLILYCYGGQKIQDESDSITNEIYESFQWESLSLSNKKILLFTMMRSQEACKVSGIFFTANLSLFLWVYRTAVSFITMLWTLEEKEKQRQ